MRGRRANEQRAEQHSEAAKQENKSCLKDFRAGHIWGGGSVNLRRQLFRVTLALYASLAKNMPCNEEKLLKPGMAVVAELVALRGRFVPTPAAVAEPGPLEVRFAGCSSRATTHAARGLRWLAVEGR